VSHIEKSAVTALALRLAKLYGPKTTISRGKVHDYLGMEMDFGSDPGTMIISMIKYLQKIIEEFPERLRGTKASPARDNLFDVREDEDRKLLPEEQASQFHRTVAQLLFLCMRARPDIQTLVSFLTTRVKEPDEDDWGKLRHGLMYLKGTLHMKRYMGAESLCIIKWWVDASYGVHWDSKGHTGAIMSMGKGAMVNISRKHKLNVGSSTESELVSIADVLGMMMWCKYFMEAQGYTIENNILYQDNKSTILLAKNGRMSAGKNSKHIKNRFFLITDKVAQEELEVHHKGTDEMWADVNTKPLQGTKFRVMRAQVMGIDVEYDDDAERRRTHPLLLPKLESVSLTWDDTEVLEKVKILAPRVSFKKGTKRGRSESIPAKRKLVPKRRSVLGCDKHSPGSGPLWGADRAKFPALYKALVGAPDGAGGKEKRDSRARVLRAPTSMKRVRRGAPTYDREGHPLLTQ